MRIALDTQSTFAPYTGIGRYTLNLLAALRRVAPQHEYLELHLGQAASMRIDQRVWWQQVQMPRQAQQAQTRLIHVPGFETPVWRSAPVVMTVHELVATANHLPWAGRLYWSHWVNFTFRFADHIITDAHYTAREITRTLGIAPHQITVIPLGVEAHFRPASVDAMNRIRERYSLATPYLLYVGTLEQKKGTDTLLEAFAALAAHCPHQLVLVGKQPHYSEWITTLLTNHGLTHRVRFIPYIPEEDLPTLYTAAEIFVFPSRHEGFGLPVLEAMACGAPVICSTAASLPEVAGEAALSVPPGERAALYGALRQLLHDPELRAQFRAKGLERARQFHWDAVARATLAVYETVLARPQVKAPSL